MFVYSSSGAPIWYVASGASYTGQQGGSLVFSGPLYQTNGPWFGGAFDPNAVGVRQVGSITFNFSEISAGTVSYTVDGVSVSKSITRQTWRTNLLTGNYLGAAVGTYSGCPSGNGAAEEPGVFTVTHPGSTITIQAAYSVGYSCTYSGTYQQSGRMGTINGTVSCSNGAQGSFTAVELEGSISGMTGRAFAQLRGSCSWSGRFGGLKR